MPTDRSGFGGETHGYSPPMTAEEAVNMAHPEWGVVWASPAAVDRYMHWLDGAALHCHRCDGLLEGPNGAPLMRTFVTNQAKMRPLLCGECREKEDHAP